MVLDSFANIFSTEITSWCNVFETLGWVLLYNFCIYNSFTEAILPFSLNQGGGDQYALFVASLYFLLLYCPEFWLTKQRISPLEIDNENHNRLELQLSLTISPLIDSHTVFDFAWGCLYMRRAGSVNHASWFASRTFFLLDMRRFWITQRQFYN